MFEKIYRLAVIILLVTLIAVNIASFVVEYQQRQKCEEAVQTYTELLSKTLDEYQTAVYDNPKVDNINKQILMANEFQVILLETNGLITLACQ